MSIHQRFFAIGSRSARAAAVARGEDHGAFAGRPRREVGHVVRDVEVERDAIRTVVRGRGAVRRRDDAGAAEELRAGTDELRERGGIAVGRAQRRCIGRERVELLRDRLGVRGVEHRGDEQACAAFADGGFIRGARRRRGVAALHARQAARSGDTGR